jgi:hypothetical protein
MWPTVLRWVVVCSMILLLAAVANDEYLAVEIIDNIIGGYHLKNVHMEFGAFNFDAARDGKSVSGTVSCDSDYIGTSCTNECQSRQVFACGAVLLPTLAVLMMSKFPRVWMTTPSMIRTRISGVLGLIGMVCGVIVLGLFAAERTAEEGETGLCAYGNAFVDPVVFHTSFIMMAVGTVLLGVASFALLCVPTGAKPPGENSVL